MRRIGTLPSQREATILQDCLYLRQIESDVEAEDDGTFAIWVHDDLQLSAASAELAKYRANPHSAEFSDASSAAKASRAQVERAEASRKSTVVDRARIGYERTFMGGALLPMILIGISILVAVYSQAGENFQNLRYLYFAWPSEDFLKLETPATGQVWRLVTPIFIHFGMLHLIFNAMWLRDLGTYTESRFGVRYLGILIFVLAASSNTMQFLWAGPWFGGMSGVNYGLFGFLWIRGKFDRSSAWELNHTIVWTMLIWYVLCLTGAMGPVANAAHTGGLVVGAAWGYLSAGRWRVSR